MKPLMSRVAAASLMAMFLAPAAPVLAAEAVLLASTAPGYTPGTAVEAGEKLSLPEGASVTLLFRSGQMLKLRGPAEALIEMPAPSRGDLFIDLEGDRLALEGGREYLFGVSDATNAYTPIWATNAAEEKLAFERVVDRIIDAFRADPALHVYHFGAYEPTAFKRLSGRYATRETELDTILRAELFVDLHSIVRHSLRASVSRSR